MSIFKIAHRLQENAGGEGGAGGGAGSPEYLKSFGEHGKAFEAFKDPASLAKAWGESQTELTTLKANAGKFDWRKEVGGADEANGKLLARYTDPAAFMKAHQEAVSKIRSGELAKPLAADAKPEEVKAWREANGIPAEAKGYFEKLPDGMVIGKDDQPAMDKWAEIFHAHNLPPRAAHALMKQYYDSLAAMQADEGKADRADQQKAIGELRNLYGKDYEPNMSILDSWLDGLPKDLKDMFKDATLGNGQRLFNNAQAVEFLVKNARELNPLAHVLPAGGEGGMKSLETEINGLKKMMGDQSSEYWKGPNAAKNQARYLELTKASLALKKTG